MRIFWARLTGVFVLRQIGEKWSVFGDVGANVAHHGFDLVNRKFRRRCFLWRKMRIHENKTDAAVLVLTFAHFVLS